MAFTALIMSLVGPIVMRALIMLGIGTVTFTGVTVALQSLINMAVNNFNSLPSDILALVSLAGIPECLGIIAGAYVARVGMWTVVSATRFVSGVK